MSLDAWIPDFTVNEEDRCKDGGGHTLVETFNDGRVQLLTCSKCGYVSSGWYRKEQK